MGYIIDNQIPNVSVGEIAISYPNGLNILNRHKIDYCCGGDISFLEACKKRGLNPETVWSEIVHVRGQGASALRVANWESSLLIDYIIQNHHVFVKESIPQIEELLDKVCAIHGEDHIELAEIRDDFNDLARELLSHLEKEEEILFPAIKKSVSNAALLKNPILAMEHEHHVAGSLLKSIRQLSNDYTVPRDACATFRILYKKLEEFDQDLMQHIHLENNVLFKRVMPLGD